MKIVIAGGTGFIGQYLARHYLEAGYNLTIVGRSRAKITQVFANSVTSVDWNTLRQTGLELFSTQDLILNLAGSGIADQRWTNPRKQDLLESRLVPTTVISALCAKLQSQSPPLFSASAIGIYGTQKPKSKSLPPQLTESNTLKINKHEFAQELVRRWESAVKPAREAGVRIASLRFGVVLGRQGGALQRLKLPYLCGLGGKIGTGHQPFSWIALPDIARAIDFLVKHPEIYGAVNLTSPHSVTQQQFAKALGRALRRPALLPTPAFVMRKLYGQMADELLLNGQHVYPEVLLNHGFNFKYPELIDALTYAFSPAK